MWLISLIFLFYVMACALTLEASFFVGAQYLLAWADKLIELKTVCHCGRKANMVLRTDEHGIAIADGEQVEIGGNERYVSVCRTHYKEALEHAIPVKG